MTYRKRAFSVLLVEDNEIDVMMMLRAARSGRLADQIDVVNDGARALAYLRGEPPYSEAPRPHLVLLDLNFPGLDGRDVLAEMKADETLHDIPVVVLTSSTLERDVLASYRGDAAAFVTNPAGFAGFQKVVNAVESFWMDVVTFPQTVVS